MQVRHVPIIRRVLVAVVRVYADEVEFAVVHAALRTDRVGKLLHLGCGAAQDHGFDAVVMVQVRVQGGHGQVMVRVLQTGQALAQVTLMVVEHIREAGHAVQRLGVALPGAFQLSAEQVPHGFGAVGIAFVRNPMVKSVGELVVQGDGEAFHTVVSVCPSGLALNIR